MMLDWEAYRREVLAGVGEIAHLSPDTVRGYAALGAAGQKADLLGAKVRELIALAVAVTVRCDGCIAVHVNAAIQTRRHPRGGRRGAGCSDGDQCRSGSGVFDEGDGRLQRQ